MTEQSGLHRSWDERRIHDAGKSFKHDELPENSSNDLMDAIQSVGPGIRNTVMNGRFSGPRPATAALRPAAGRRRGAGGGAPRLRAPRRPAGRGARMRSRDRSGPGADPDRATGHA